MDMQQSRKFRIILTCLLSSLLLHGFFLLAVTLFTPKQFQKQPAVANIVMVELARTHQKAGASTPVQSLPAALAAKEPFGSVTQTETVPAITSPPISGMSASKRVESLQESRFAIPGGPSHSKTASISHQAPNTSGHTVSSGNSQPQELTFGSASGPAFLKQTAPVYPALAKRRGREGSVLLRLRISETGQLTQVEVLEDPGYGFAEAALEAVRSSSFTPAHHNGKAVAIRALLPIRFALR